MDNTLIIILFTVAIIGSALFWSISATTLINHYKEYLSYSFFYKPWILIFTGICMLFIMFYGGIKILDHYVDYSPEKFKYEQITDPVYKKIEIPCN